jgi:hypothetical protein
MTQASRTTLRQIPLADVQVPGSQIVTMSVGQWDALLARLYEENWVLLELDECERPIRAYRKAAH